MEQVTLTNEKLDQLFDGNNYKLSIPPYQRIYCWEEKNVLRLLDDLKSYAQEKEYRMGSIILQRNGDKYDIIDGQQRLVTFTLLLLSLKYQEDIPLKHEKFQSSEAQAYVAYNKYVIDQYVDQYAKTLSEKDTFRENILKNVSFSVLVLQDTSLDLAYTFFSNQNSRGKALSDYDLLKAHHLRFINSEEESKHLAQRWDKILLKHTQESGDMNQLFDIYLFRLRKWMRKDPVYNNPYHVKQEFEAAPIIEGIPPFGERFYYYEKMQGGSHFFAYAERFIFAFEQFKNTAEYDCLHKGLAAESHYWYRNIIEAFLFAYFLKFGVSYLSEALFCIARVISDYRYEAGRMNRQKILDKAGQSELILMIDQATSPTFFLAEALSIPVSAKPSKPDIRERYRKTLKEQVIDKLNISSEQIKNKIKEYVQQQSK
jgi:hypothetical protein